MSGKGIDPIKIPDPRITAVYELVKTNIESATGELENALERSGFLVFIEQQESGDPRDEREAIRDLAFAGMNRWGERVAEAAVAGIQRAMQAGQNADEAKKEVTATLALFKATDILDRIADERGAFPPNFTDGEEYLENIDRLIANAVATAHLQELATSGLAQRPESVATAPGADHDDRTRVGTILRKPKATIDEARLVVGWAMGIDKPCSTSWINRLLSDGTLQRVGRGRVDVPSLKAYYEQRKIKRESR